MTQHSKPNGNMSAAQLVALFNDAPNALSYELAHCGYSAVLTLAYGEYAERPLRGVPAALAEMAYDEMDRRDNALSSLKASIAAARQAA